MCEEGLPASKSCGIVTALEKGEQRERKDGKVLRGNRGGLMLNRQPSAILDGFTVMERLEQRASDLNCSGQLVAQ